MVDTPQRAHAANSRPAAPAAPCASTATAAWASSVCLAFDLTDSIWAEDGPEAACAGQSSAMEQLHSMTLERGAQGEDHGPARQNEVHAPLVQRRVDHLACHSHSQGIFAAVTPLQQYELAPFFTYTISTPPPTL